MTHDSECLLWFGPQRIHTIQQRRVDVIAAGGRRGRQCGGEGVVEESRANATHTHDARKPHVRLRTG